MDAEFKAGRRIAVVATRDLTAKAGRPAILSAIVASLERTNDVRLLRLRNVMELGETRDLTSAFSRWSSGVMRGRPLPLQCVLYSSRRECDRIIAEIVKGEFDAVYLDTVRCHALLHGLRSACPHLHIVTDFDDLMSRRMKFLSQNSLPFLTGHTSSSFPGWMRSPIETWLSHVVTRYEAMTLPSADDEVIAQSDATILLSQVERELAAQRQSHDRAASISTILPALTTCAPPWSGVPRRFIFIGSGALLQNRTAIAALIDKWCALRPTTELHIYGRQAGPIPKIPNVFFHGFVDDLAEVYQPGSIAVVPALGTGGIKTKVAEAWAWGCPVLCNSAALEGLGIEDYPLVLPEHAWDHLITEPQDFTALWRFGAQLGHDFVRRSMSPEAFNAAWQRIMRTDSITSAQIVSFAAPAAARARSSAL